MHEKAGVPASSADRARQNREMVERKREEAAEREAERERSRLSGIEYEQRWAAIYATMELDNTIEIPGRCGGEDIVIRAKVGPGGRLIEVEIEKRTDTHLIQCPPL